MELVSDRSVGHLSMGRLFFGRYDEASVSSLNKFQFRTTSGTYTLRGYLMHQLWLREENVDLDVSVTTPITVTADIESGLIFEAMGRDRNVIQISEEPPRCWL